jgi:large repetitive protein
MRRDLALAYPRKTRPGLLGRLALIVLTLTLFVLPPPQIVHAAPTPTPTASLAVPGTQFIGEPLRFTVAFDNTGDAPGYGPYVDLLIPTSGVDGGVTVDPDSLDFTAATYLGIAVDSTKQTCVAGATLVHPLTGRTATCPAAPANARYQLVTLRLPFGSFTPAQPLVSVDVTAALGPNANLGVPLSITATPGFQFGVTPTGKPLTDSIVGAATSATVTPTVLTLAKTYIGPESETATGPNYPRQYRLDVDVASGQTVTNLDVTDLMPDNVAFLRVVSTAPAGASVLATPTVGVAASSPNNRLTVRFPTVTGTTAAADATVVLEFFVPRTNAVGQPVLDPVTGAPALSPDAATAAADWLPTDARDRLGTGKDQPVHVGAAPTITATHTLTDRSLAIQKTVAVASSSAHSDVRPGATLEYHLNFQVSDYFAFDNVVVRDVFSDGQHLDPTFTPTLQIDGNPDALAAADVASNNWSVTDHYTGAVTPVAPIDGTTELAFRVSNEIVSRGQANGRLFGGCVPLGGGPSDCAAQNAGPTTGTIVFRTVILENYTDRSLGGDFTVTQKDTLADDVTVQGDVLDTSVVGSLATPTGSTVSDTSHASVVVVAGTLSKAIVAVNGGAPGSPVLAAPGRTITYRLTYSPPASDFKLLRLIDYLPLPVLSAAEVTAFDAVVNDSPAAGHMAYGSGDTFHLKSGAPTPVLSRDAAQNAITLDYGSFNDLGDTPSTIEILFTVTVSNSPFADGLYLTNQLRATDSNTESVSRIGDAIVQFRLTEPVLGITKGVVATSNPNAAFSQTIIGPAAFSAPGSAGTRFAAPFGSPDLTIHPIDSNLTGVDAGDLVTFAVVVENTGSGLSGAYNVQVKDTLPAGFVVPSGGLNLNVTNAAGEPIAYADLGGGFFGNGLQFTDPAPNQGALAAGKNGLGVVIADGRNVAVVTYDLQLADTVTPRQTITNTASLLGYANSPGGPTFLAAPLTDDATVATASPALAKSLESSEIENTANARNRAVIGELVTYKVTATLPEGVTPNATIVDTLPTGLAFVDFSGYTASSGVTFTGSATPTITNSGRTVTFNLGDVTNANRDNATAETISLIYRAVVLNVPGNLANTSLTNSASLSWTGDSLPAVHAPSVTVIEPTLTTTKSVVVGASGTSGDAGDPVAYTIAIKHAAGAFDTDAFGVTFGDPLPKSPTNQSLILGPTFAVVDSAGLVTAASFELVGSDAAGWTLQTPLGTAFDFPLAPADRTITITVNGTIASAVYSGQSIPNIATTSWTSLSGAPGQRSTYNTSSTERTGADGVGGALNKYAAKGTATITVFGPSPAKSVVATSEAHTTGSYVAVGEIVRYRLVTRLAQGVSPSFKLVDALPTGLRYLNDGTTKVALVSSLPPKSNGGAITSSTLAGAGLSVDGDESTVGTVTPTFVLPAGAITPASFVDGTDPTFSLGDLTNAARDGHQGYVVVEFNALVGNVSTNQAFDNALGTASATNRDNSFAVWVNGASVAASGAARVTIAEPVIRNLAKAVTTTPRDAGDTVVYTLTYSNTASSATAAAAFDVRLLDTLDANLVLQVVNVTAKPAYASVTDSTNMPGNAVDLTVSELRPGDGVTVTVTAKVKDAARAGQQIPNTASLTYASLPGPNGTISNPTGSSTPGGTGTATGRRDDSNSTGGLNDYLSGANASLITLATPSLDKLAPSPTSYPIGDVVSYDLVVTLPEGITRSLVVVDTLPAGLAYVDAEVITSAAASGGILAADFAGAPATPTITSPAGSSGGDVTLAFGDTTVAPTAGTTANKFLVRVRARVANVPANRNGQAPTNSGRLTYQNPNDNSTAIVNAPTPRTITVIEPLLNVAKSRDQATPDAGDVVTYTVTVSHKAASASVARDIVLSDALPAGVTNAVVTGVTATGITAPDATVSAGAVRVPASGSFDLPLGATVTVTYTATVVDAILPGQTVANTANVKWTSLPGASAFERGSGDGFVGGGGLNDYENQAVASFTVPTPTFAKTLAGTSEAHTSDPNVAVGEAITYALTLTVPEGVTPGVTFVDTLPAGLGYVAGSAVAAPSADVSISGSATPVITNGGTTLTFNLGDVTNANRNNAATDTIKVTYQAVVLNSSGSQTGTTLQNSAIATWSGNPLPVSRAPAVTVVEPVISNLQKTVTTTPKDAGDTVVYTLTYSNTGNAAAFDVRLLDTLDPTLDLLSVVVDTTAPNSVDASTLGLGGQVDVSLPKLLPGEAATVTVTARVSGTVNPGAIVANTSNLTYTSLPGSRGTGDVAPGLSGAVDGERDGSGAVNDYRAQASASFTVAGPTFAKTLRGTSAAHTAGSDVTIGETVTYALAVTLPEGTTPALRVVDSLPAGLGYLAASVDRTGFLGTVPEPTINATIGVGGDVTLDFGETLVTPDNDPTNNTFVVVVTARVLDEPGNVGVAPRTALDNQATLSVGGTTIAATPVTVTVTEPKLSIDKHISALSGVNHDTATVTLSVQNTGTATAFDVVVDDPLSNAMFREIAPGTTPAGFAFGLVADGDRTIVRYTGSSLAATPGQNTATFTFTVRLAAAEIAGRVFANTATVTRAMTLPPSDPESAAARNEGPVSASDSLTVPAQVNLGVRKTQIVDPVQPFGLAVAAAGRRYNVDYTLSYSNDGTTAAHGVVLTEKLAAGATLRGPASTWTTTDGLTYAFAVGDLAAGASGTVRFDVRSAPLAGGDTVANTVTIGDDGASGLDVDATDNSASVSYTAPSDGPTATPTATATTTPRPTATPGGPPTATPTPTITPTATPLPAATSVAVASDAVAQLRANGGSVEVIVPAGAVDTPATLVYTAIAPPARTFDYAALQAFSLSWQGAGPATLGAPAVITIGYDQASLNGLIPTTLTIRRQDASGNWVVVPSYQDPVARTVSAATTTLGRFALTAEPIKYWIWLPEVLR